MKNTIVKLFLALAMCFLIGGSLIACAGETGPKGDKGDKGEAPEITINADGYWCVDGESTGVKAQGEDFTACDHKDSIVSYVLEKHTATKDGVYLDTCTKCNDYARVAYESRHIAGEPETVPATCTDPKYVGTSCIECGKHLDGNYEGDSLGHDWTAELKPVAASTETVCENGGMMVKHCQRCYEVDEPQFTDAIGHTVAEGGWTYNGLVATGTCANCQNTVTYTLPEYNDTDYTFEWKDGVAVSCMKDAYKVYKYVVKGEMNDEMVWDTNIDFTSAAQLVRAPGHSLAGKGFAEWALAGYEEYDGYVLPYYADVDGDGKVAAGEELGLKAFADNEFECRNVEKGYFLCPGCEEAVYVYVYMEHNGEVKEGQKAYCYAPGYDYVDCSNCDAEAERVTTYAAHNYEFKLDNNNDGTFTLTATCVTVRHDSETGEKCGDTYTKLIAEEDLATIEVVAPTCYADGYTVYEFVERDAEENVLGTATVKVIAEKTAHTLDGKLQTAYDVIYSNVPGIKEFADIPFEMCGETYKAYYLCSVCVEAAKTNDEINPVVYVDVVKAHKLAETVIEEAECEVDGSKSVECVYDNCDHAEDAVAIPAEGHDYTYTYTVKCVEDVYYLNLKGVCSVCDNELVYENVEMPALDSEEYETEVKKAGTCTEGTVIEFSIECEPYQFNDHVDTLEIVFEVNVGTTACDLDTDHLLHKTVEKEDGFYTYYFYVCKTCGSYEVVDLEFEAK